MIFKPKKDGEHCGNTIDKVRSRSIKIPKLQIRLLWQETDIKGLISYFSIKNLLFKKTSKEITKINYKDHIMVNNLIDLEINIEKGSDKQKEVFCSRVEDIGPDSIIVAAPLKKGSVVPVPVSEEVLIRIGKDGAQYLFHTRVIERKGGQQPVLKLSLPFDTTNLEMRNWVRVDSNLPVLYRVLGSEDELNESSTLNVSGGGICMVVDKPVEKDAHLELKVIMPDNTALQANGTVCRCILENKFTKLGICFNEIDEHHQEIIVDYVFKKHSEVVKKGFGKTTTSR